MSGGSFEYLYRREAYELLSEFQFEMVESMALELAKADGGDAAIATWELIGALKTIKRTLIDLDVSTEALREVWHAMEWWQSNDIGEDGFEKALATYREAMKDKEHE